MGQVLQVRDEDVGREMAAKVIHGQDSAQALAKFVREAQITGQLEHPNIVPTHELGTTPDGQFYFTMKRIEGQDLAALLQDEDENAKGRTLYDYLQILLKVCDAISLAHSRGVIHRDLKPANIMIGQFGEVQVMDWGLARLVGQSDTAEAGCTLDLGGGHLAERARRSGSDEPLRTLDGAVVGTPHYMPPEQARGEVRKLDQRADVYALGAILYQMLTLEPPFEGDSVWDVLERVIEGQPTPPSERTLERDIPGELEAVVLKAMQHMPVKRYDTVDRMKQDLEAYLEGRLLQAADYSTWQVLKKWAARHKAAAAATAGIALALLIGLVATYRQLLETRSARDDEKTQRIRALEGETRAYIEQAKAVRNWGRAEQEQALKDAARKRMGDVRAEEVLREQFEDLGPQAWKEQDLANWSVTATVMLTRIPAHEKRQLKLESMTKREDVDDWELAILPPLIQRIAKLKSKLSMVNRWLRDKPWRKWQVLNETVHRVPWEQAIAAIRAHPKYSSLELNPQEGLLPLGPDPKSKLWEFAHLPSGKAPVRGAGNTWQITGQTCVVLVLVPGGQFLMGASDGDTNARDDEKPVHRVKLAPFFLSKYELTQGQWMRLAKEKQ